MNDIMPWKRYAITLAEVWLGFCIATFSMGIYFTHFINTPMVIIFGVILAILYVFIIGACIRRLIERFSVAALMIMVPIAPLAVLLLIVSLLPIIQKLM